jgi:DNA-directed RNA polymerase specialized sigma24 family protein
MRMSPREAEFTAFLEARSGELMRFGYLLTRHEADAADLVQDALVQVWSRRSGDDIGNLGAYVRTTMVRRYISQCRRSERWRAVRDLLVRNELARALDRLSPMQRATFCLQLFEDLSVDDIAARLDCSPGGVKRHLSDARRRLAESFTTEERSHDH